MGRLKFTLACSLYDRIYALADGSVAPEGYGLELYSLRSRGNILASIEASRIRRIGDVILLVHIGKVKGG